jgi:hypothetical protein
MRRTRWIAVGIGALWVACAGEDPDALDAQVRRWYVLSSIRIEPLRDGLASGLDLDGVDSSGGATCADTPDVASIRDAAEVGVDNAVAAMVPDLGRLLEDGCPAGIVGADCLQHLIAEDIADGEGVLVVEVRDLDHLRDDADVEVVIHRATLPSAPVLVDGVLAPDQRFDLEEITPPMRGAIEARVLRASSEPLVTLPVGAGPDLDIALPLHGMRIEATLDGPALVDGVIAGGLDVDALYTPVCDPGPCDIPNPFAAGADLAPSEWDPTVCAQMSAAIDFETVRALPGSTR